jgi:lipoate---protein ligase
MAPIPSVRFVTRSVARVPDHWTIARRRSTASEFHALPIPDDPQPQIWVHELTAPALVLGSMQRDDVVDRSACARAGVEVVRRRSGGGAVWLAPDEVVWIDMIIPRGVPGWSDDIHRPMVWLGHHLAEAFQRCGVDDVNVHDGAMATTAHSRLICFDGLGPGELTRGAAKLVGISQRRTRDAARLQCCWYSAYRPESLTAMLRTDVDLSALRPVAVVERDAAMAIPEMLATSLRLAVTPTVGAPLGGRQ